MLMNLTIIYRTIDHLKSKKNCNLDIILSTYLPYLLRLPIGQIYEGGNSKARNPRIQNMLRMVGFGENIGSGFPKIISVWKETNWGEPELKNKIELDEVELILPVPTMGQRQENGSFVSSNETKDDPKDDPKDDLKDILKKSI
ncbi:MAG: hypothetical protein IKH88_10055 [Prevotella sp.]|nr:hypothetical protein [Prevotella sp.]